MRHGNHCNCGCQKPMKEIVHPVKQNVVHHCTEETVMHVHPSHTTVMNHHVVNNKHVYPHSTSVNNSVEEVDMYGGPNNNGNQVAGAMNNGMPGTGMGNCHKHVGGMHHGKRPPKWC